MVASFVYEFLFHIS